MGKIRKLIWGAHEMARVESMVEDKAMGWKDGKGFWGQVPGIVLTLARRPMEEMRNLRVGVGTRKGRRERGDVGPR